MAVPSQVLRQMACIAPNVAFCMPCRNADLAAHGLTEAVAERAAGRSLRTASSPVARTFWRFPVRGIDSHKPIGVRSDQRWAQRRSMPDVPPDRVSVCREPSVFLRARGCVRKAQIDRRLRFVIRASLVVLHAGVECGDGEGKGDDAGGFRVCTPSSRSGCRGWVA